MQTVDVLIGGTTYNLKFSMNALAKFEEKVGMGFKKFMFTQEMEIAGLRMLLWAGLIHKHPRLTPDEAGDLIQKYTDAGGAPDDLTMLCFKGMEKAGLIKLPKEDAKGDENPPQTTATPETAG